MCVCVCVQTGVYINACAFIGIHTYIAGSYRKTSTWISLHIMFWSTNLKLKLEQDLIGIST